MPVRNSNTLQNSYKLYIAVVMMSGTYSMRSHKHRSRVYAHKHLCMSSHLGKGAPNRCERYFSSKLRVDSAPNSASSGRAVCGSGSRRLEELLLFPVLPAAARGSAPLLICCNWTNPFDLSIKRNSRRTDGGSYDKENERMLISHAGINEYYE